MERPTTTPAMPAAPIRPAEAAQQAGLRYVSTAPLPPGIRRVRSGRGFRYVDPGGAAVRDPATLSRIRALAVPPAWTDVWICASPDGHLQALGRDARGRLQYRYHPRWHAVRDETKFGQLVAFGRLLPALRRRVRADLARPGLPREKVLATVVQLLDRTGMRVGNEEYARANGSFGLTTLRNRHATVAAGVLELRFRGKSGREQRVRLDDPRLARVVKACQDIPGHELFQYLDAGGERQSIGSADVNAYLRAITGAEITAKVFRTWTGTVKALAALKAAAGALAAAEANRRLVEVVKATAAALGNTPAVCRKAYIHPAVIEAFLAGDLPARLEAPGARAPRGRGLDADERLALVFLAGAGRRRRRAAPGGPAPPAAARRVARPGTTARGGARGGARRAGLGHTRRLGPAPAPVRRGGAR